MFEDSLKLSFLYQYCVCSSKSETIVQFFVCRSISVFRFDLLHSIENVLSYTYVIPNFECISSAKSFSFGNLSLLTSFQKLSTVCRDKQLTGSQATFVMPRLADR